MALSSTASPAFVISVISALVGALGFLLTWWRYREESLRRGEVLSWANEAIDALEGLIISCILKTNPAFKLEANQRLSKIAFESAILVERGRIFFRISHTAILAETRNQPIAAYAQGCSIP